MNNPKIKIYPQITDKYDAGTGYILVDPTKEGKSSIKAEIENWDKLEVEEQKNLAWVWSICNNKPNFQENAYNPDLGIGKGKEHSLSFTKIYWGGIGWLEPYIHGKSKPTNSTKNGVFVQVKTTPKVLGYEWREYDAGNDGAVINREVKYGETIQLHIYTDGLFGEDIEILLFDDKNKAEDLPMHEKEDGKWKKEEERLELEKINKNKLPNSFSRILREVGVFVSKNKPAFQTINSELKNGINYQKCVTNIYVDPVWSFYANSENNKFNENSIKLKASIFFSDKELVCNKNSITLLGLSNEVSFLKPEGNKVAIVGEVQTNYANFLPCGYSEIHGKYKKNEEEVDIQVFPLKDNPNPTQLVFPIVAGVDKMRKELTVELKDVRSNDCLHEGKLRHTGKVIDISKIESLLKPDNTTRKRQWRLAQSSEIFSGGEAQTKKEEDKSKLTQAITLIDGGKKLKMQSGFKILENYYPFEYQPPTDELLKLKLGYDYTWGNTVSPLSGLIRTIWPNSGIAVQKYPVGLNTCAFRTPLYIAVYPDTKWTLQIAYNYDGKEFNELREEYHETWKLKELEADERINQLKEQRQGNISGSKKKKNKRKIQQASQERSRARKNNSVRSQAKNLMQKAHGTLDAEYNLICEFDRPYAALNFSSEFLKAKEFLHKIVSLKELIEKIVKGNNTETTRSSPTGNATITNRKAKLQELMNKRGGEKKSNWSFELTPPKVGLSVSWCAEAAADLKSPEMGTLIEGAIDLNPLFGIEAKYDLYQLLYKIKHPVVLAVVAILDVLDEALGDNFDINLDLIINSEIFGSLKGSINTASGSSFTNRLMKDDDGSPCKFGGKVSIAIKGYLQANGSMKVFVFWKSKAYLEASVEVKSGIALEFVTKADTHSIYVEPEVKFEGLLLEANVSLGFVADDAGTDNISELKEKDGIHYTADGKIVVLDPYTWKTGWKLPII